MREFVLSDEEKKVVALFGYNRITSMVRKVAINEERILVNPIVEGDDDGLDMKTMQGIQYLYSSMLPTSTRMQITFTNDDFNALPLDKGIMESIKATSVKKGKSTSLACFDNHPDITIKSQLLVLFDMLSKDGFRFRLIPWEHELLHLQDGNEFAGMVGIFFPTLHFRNDDLGYTVIVRCEPIVTM